MIPNIVTGSGITGAIRYVVGEGRNPDTNERRFLLPGETSRAQIIGGTGFGFIVQNEDDLELARRVMEWNGRPENQASKTRKCTDDCLHMSLSWDAGQQPDLIEMHGAAVSALAALGMEDAQAIFVAHNDTDHAHLHIVASRINPLTGKTYNIAETYIKSQAWAIRWERENGYTNSPARDRVHEIADAVEAKDWGTVLDRLTDSAPTFTQADLQKAVGLSGVDKAAREEISQEVLTRAEVVGLRELESATITRYTTEKVLASEAAIIQNAEALADTSRFAADQAELRAAGQRFTLDDEQAAAMRRCTDGSGFALIAGEAGTGKSRTFGAIREAYEASGYDVVGLSWTNAVVQDMRGDGFKQANTLASEFKRIENGRGTWDSATVLMVDEAAMISTKHLDTLLAYAKAARAKVILAGDDRQLASIERGGMFTALRQEHGAAELHNVRRVTDTEQRQAFNLMHKGEFLPALSIFDQQAAIHWQETPATARVALVDRYGADVAVAPDKRRFIFAYTNADVAKLNEAARTVHRERGDLGDDHQVKTAHGVADFAAGDRIQFTGNAYKAKDKAAGLVNSAVGTVKAITERDGATVMTVALDGAKRREVTFTVGENKQGGEFNSFRHGYAGTIYKGQGKTLDQTYVYVTKQWRSASSYVALTRHRESVAIFAPKEIGYPAARMPGPAAGQGIVDPTQQPSGALVELARQMARADEKRAASAFVPDRTNRHRAGPAVEPVPQPVPQLAGPLQALEQPTQAPAPGAAPALPQPPQEPGRQPSAAPVPPPDKPLATKPTADPVHQVADTVARVADGLLDFVFGTPQQVPPTPAATAKAEQAAEQAAQRVAQQAAAPTVQEKANQMAAAPADVRKQMAAADPDESRRVAQILEAMGMAEQAQELDRDRGGGRKRRR